MRKNIKYFLSFAVLMFFVFPSLVCAESRDWGPVCEPVVHTVTVEHSAGGRTSPTGPVTVTEGSDQSFRIISDSGYKLKSLTVNDVDVTHKVENDTYTLESVGVDVLLKVEFEKLAEDEFSLSVSKLDLALSGGVVSGTISADVSAGVGVRWAVENTDIATVSPDFGVVTTVTARQAGSTRLIATATDGVTETTAECSITVKATADTSSGGGGCNVGGFAPALLLLATPLVFLLKK